MKFLISDAGVTPVFQGPGSQCAPKMATELQIGLPKLHERIRREVIKSGIAHWTTVTGRRRQRHNGRRRSNVQTDSLRKIIWLQPYCRVVLKS